MTVTTVCDELADAIFAQGYLVTHVEVKISTPYRPRESSDKPGRGKIYLEAEVLFHYSEGVGRNLAPKTMRLCTTSNPIEPDSKVHWNIGDCGPGTFSLIGLKDGGDDRRG